MNLDTLAGMAGQSIGIQDLTELNKALRNAGQTLSKATVGSAGSIPGFGGTGDFAPLIPQSIQSTLDTATYTEQAVVLWKMMQKVSVSSTLHETVRVNSYGNMALDPFIAEGGVGPASDGEYERLNVPIRFLAEQREISDVATMVGIVGYNGVSRQGLAQQTIDGTRALMGKLERAMFSADHELSALQFDGIYKQITGATFTVAAGDADVSAADGTATNVTDMQGKAITAQDLVEKIYEVFAAPNFGMVNKILVEPRVYAALVNIATSHGRFQLPQAGRGELIFGTEGLKIAGPSGLVDITSCPLMLPPDTISHSAKVGGENPPTDLGGFAAAAVARGAAPANSLAQNQAGLKQGTYKWRVVAVNDDGIGVPSVASAAVAIAEDGDVARLTVTDANLGQQAKFYRVYRADVVNGVDGEFRYMWSFPRREAAATDTTIIDNGRHLPGTAPVYLLQATPDVMYWAQLLDFLRRPLAQVKTTVPFLLMLFGAPHVKIPTKAWVLDNCALSAG